MKFKIKITKGKKGKSTAGLKPRGEMTPEKKRKMEELSLLRQRSDSNGESEGAEETELESPPLPSRGRIKATKREKEKRPPPPNVFRVESSLSEKIKAISREKKAPPKKESASNIIEWGVLSMLVWTPLIAGSVNDWAILAIQLSVLILAVNYIWKKNKPGPPEYFPASLKWRKYFFLGLVFILLLQIVPFPKFLVKILSPNSYTLRSTYIPDFSKIKFLTLSVIPTATIKQILQFLSYFLFGFLILKTMTKRKQILRLMYVIIGMGVFQAFYGLFELYNPNPRILFFNKIHNLDSVTGTFVNRNHLSGYLEMAIPLAIGLILSRLDLFSMGKLKLRERILKLSEKGLSTNLLISASILIMAIGIVLSKSRSGVFLLVFSFLLFLEFTVLFMGKTQYRQRWTKRFLQLMFLGITFISLYVGVGAAIERFALDKVLHEGRPHVWANTLGIARDFPLFGSGLGTFDAVYPAYEIRNLDRHYSHAHNDYLEYLAEVGFIGMLLLMGGILFLLYTTFRVWRERRNPEVKGLVMGGIVAVICMLIHSISDFNLHIPANMLLFTAVLTLVYNTAFYKFMRPSSYR